MPPKLLAKNNDRAGGVLPVTAAARAAPAKNSNVRLKLEIRRLPPGLTLTEFEETLGDEWKLGNGKVDWREYRQGKVKTSAGKIPDQSRCYLHLTGEALVKELETRFFNVIFHDKAGTHRNHDIRNLPPTLGYAPNQRTPLNVKVRSDNRQGTIDQDSEFIAFLEAETQPITKPASLDAVGAEKKEVEKVEITSTPLIDALREKKANKAKAAASKEEKKEGKGHVKAESKDVAVEEKAKDTKGGSTKKPEPPPKELTKAGKKQIVTKQQQASAASPQQAPAKPASPAKTKKAAPSPKPQAATPASPANATPAAAAQSPAPQRPARQRGNADGIKKMLQKDLGIRPKSSSNASTATPTPTTTAPISSPPSTPASSTPQQSSSNPSTNNNNNKPTKPIPVTTHSPSLKAYLKHANPSQGMTEMLIQQALGQHGDVASVTIDPRKGTAIAIFRSVEGLKKAIEAKKVPVANGSVEVLEFRDRGGGGGGGNAAAAATAANNSNVGGNAGNNNNNSGGGGQAGGRGGFRGRGGRGGRGGGGAGGGAAAAGGNNAGGNANANAKGGGKGTGTAANAPGQGQGQAQGKAQAQVQGQAQGKVQAQGQGQAQNQGQAQAQAQAQTPKPAQTQTPVQTPAQAQAQAQTSTATQTPTQTPTPAQTQVQAKDTT